MFEIMLEAALRATFIAAAALGALWALRVRAAAARHRVWTVVMLAMLALPLAMAWAPDVSLRVLPPTYAEVSSVAAPPPDSGTVVAPTVQPSDVVELAPVRPGSSRPWNWRVWLIAVYFAGAAVLLARLAVGTVRVRWLAREATVVNGLLTSPRTATPFTFGLLKPKIVLPEGWRRWAAPRLAIVLDHEGAHVARRDPLVQWLALLNRAVFWFHPLAWWLERHLAALAEEACDAAVLARGHSPTDYSEQLLHLARLSTRRATLRLTGMPMPGSALPTRLEKILDGGIGRTRSRAGDVAAAALATLAAAALGTITLAQETAPPVAQEAAPSLAQEAAPPIGQETARPRTQETASSRTLLEVYELALANDPIVRQAEAEYRAVAAASPRSSDAVAGAAADSEAARQELLLRVAEPYFDVLAAESALALRATERATLSRQLEQAEQRFEVGLIDITDVDEARAELDRAAADVLTAQRALDAAQQTLRGIVGEPVGELRPLVEDLPLVPPDPSSAEEWIETALERNPVLVSTRIRAESADGDLVAGEDIERIARRTELETRAAYHGVVSEISRALALERAATSSQKAFRATRAGFDAGTRTSTAVSAAQINLREVETAHARSRYDYALNVLRLRGAVGGLTPEGLEDTRSWFE